MNENIIKSFLVSIGFDVDDKSKKDVDGTLGDLMKSLGKVSAAIKATAGAVAYGIARISGDFEELGLQMRMIYPSITRAMTLRAEFSKAYAAAGTNIHKVVMQSYALNTSLMRTRVVVESVYKSVAARFFDVFAKRSDQLRAYLYRNMTKIQNTLEKFVVILFKVSGHLFAFSKSVIGSGERVYSFFEDLDKKTNGLSTKLLAIGAALIAIDLTNLASKVATFVASMRPLYLILALIYLLIDDYQVWKRGGDSLINWGSKWTKAAEWIVGAATLIYGIMKVVGAYISGKAFLVGTAIPRLISLWSAFAAGIQLFAVANPFGFIITALGAILTLVSLIASNWDSIKEFGGWIGSKFSWISGEGMEKQKPLMGSWAGGYGAAGLNVVNNVQSNANINVTGSADPAATARMVQNGQATTFKNATQNLATKAR